MERASSAIFSGELDSRTAAAATLVGNLRRCEALAGELYAAQGHLAASAIAAEEAMDLSAVAGQQFLNAIAAAQSNTATVRGYLVTGHRQLERLGQALQLDMADFGDTTKPPQALADTSVGPLDR